MGRDPEALGSFSDAERFVLAHHAPGSRAGAQARGGYGAPLILRLTS